MDILNSRLETPDTHTLQTIAVSSGGAILRLTARTTVTSASIPEEDTCHRARNLCVFSHVQKGTPGLTHKECV